MAASEHTRNQTMLPILLVLGKFFCPLTFSIPFPSLSSPPAPSLGIQVLADNDPLLAPHPAFHQHRHPSAAAAGGSDWSSPVEYDSHAEGL